VSEAPGGGPTLRFVLARPRARSGTAAGAAQRRQAPLPPTDRVARLGLVADPAYGGEEDRGRTPPLHRLQVRVYSIACCSFYRIAEGFFLGFAVPLEDRGAKAALDLINRRSGAYSRPYSLGACANRER
jgi:hypothetical protein